MSWGITPVSSSLMPVSRDIPVTSHSSFGSLSFMGAKVSISADITKHFRTFFRYYAHFAAARTARDGPPANCSMCAVLSHESVLHRTCTGLTRARAQVCACTRKHPPGPENIFFLLFVYRKCDVICVVVCVVVCVACCVVNRSEMPCTSEFRCVVGCVVECAMQRDVGCAVKKCPGAAGT